MSGLVLPEHLVKQTRDYAGELDALGALAVLTDEVKHWTKELKAIDEALELVWIPENITPHPAIVPGRFHIVEKRPLPAPPNVLPLVKGCVTGDPEDDGFIEPGAWMFEWLRKNDHWSQRSQRIREERMAAAESARQRAHEREQEDMAVELDERIKALINPGVSMHKGNRSWSQRAGARRAR
jgi:hypothetical protein